MNRNYELLQFYLYKHLVKRKDAGHAELVSASAKNEFHNPARNDAFEKMLYPPRSFKMVDTCAGEFDAETFRCSFEERRCS